MEIGTVKWFNERKGFGFIKRDGHPDLFVHFSEIKANRRTLLEGQKVTFDVKQTIKGWQATGVVKHQLLDEPSDQKDL